MTKDKRALTLETGVIMETTKMNIKHPGRLIRVNIHRGEASNLLAAFELGEKIKRKLSNDQIEPANNGHKNNREVSDHNSIQQDRQSQGHREGRPFFGSRYSFVC